MGAVLDFLKNERRKRAENPKFGLHIFPSRIALMLSIFYLTSW
jgi:hypothetical protein